MRLSSLCTQENYHQRGQRNLLLWYFEMFNDPKPVDLATSKWTVIKVTEENKNPSLFRSRNNNLCSQLPSAKMNWTWWRGHGQTSLMKWAEGCILTIRWNSACVTALPLAIRQDTIPKPSNQIHNPSLIAWEVAHANTGGNREVMSTKGWEESLQWIREYSAWNLWKQMFRV